MGGASHVEHFSISGCHFETGEREYPCMHPLSPRVPNDEYTEKVVMMSNGVDGTFVLPRFQVSTHVPGRGKSRRKV